MESADTFHHVASASRVQDRDYYNMPTTHVDQSNYAQLSAAANDNRTYSHLNTTAGQ